MIFSLFIIHDHDRMSPITRVLHTATWDFLTSGSFLSLRFRHSPKSVKEAIIADIDDLGEELMTSSDGAIIGPSFLEMRRLFGIFQECFQVCFHIITVFCECRLT